MIKEIKKQYVTPESNILKIGSIYTLTISVTSSSMEKTETLYEGTPVKIISIYDEKTKRVECIDYRGVHHFINYDYLSDLEIKKYPNQLKIVLNRIKNILSDKIFRAVICGVILICFLTSFGICMLPDLIIDTVPIVDIIILGAIETLGVIFLFLVHPEKNLLYTKENLRELKILFNKKGAKTGSEAFTKDEGVEK